MADHAAFLRAIIAAPDDDLPRLVFSDWLDERGEGDRAEFIRVQCELALTPEPNELTFGCLHNGPCPDECRKAHCVACRKANGDFCRSHTLRARERGLLLGHGCSCHMKHSTNYACWVTATLPDVRWQKRPTVEFRRGFISEITLSWDDWQRHASALLESCPLRRVNRGKRAERHSPHCPGAPGCLSDPTRFYGCSAQQVDDWRGDGLVRLTTPPIFAGPVIIGDGDLVTRERLLAERWPGVRFELPAGYIGPQHYANWSRGRFTSRELEQMHRGRSGRD